MANASTKNKKDAGRVLVQNRKARHLYEIVEKFEAGMELRGSEVKSLRDGKGSIAEAYAISKEGEMWVIGMRIEPYEKAGVWTQNPLRERKLLLHKKQIDRLAGGSTQKGMTIVPLSVYLTERGLVKMEIGLARGKSSSDKREDIKERTIRREMDREYKVR